MAAALLTDESKDVLDGEPGYADRLDHGQVLVVLAVLSLQVGDGVEGHADGGHDDEGDGDYADHLRNGIQVPSFLRNNSSFFSYAPWRQRMCGASP